MSEYGTVPPSWCSPSRSILAVTPFGDVHVEPSISRSLAITPTARCSRWGGVGGGDVFFCRLRAYIDLVLSSVLAFEELVEVVGVEYEPVEIYESDCILKGWVPEILSRCPSGLLFDF